MKVAGTAKGCSCDRRRDVPHDRRDTRGASTEANRPAFCCQMLEIFLLGARA